MGVEQSGFLHSFVISRFRREFVLPGLVIYGFYCNTTSTGNRQNLVVSMVYKSNTNRPPGAGDDLVDVVFGHDHQSFAVAVQLPTRVHKCTNHSARRHGRRLIGQLLLQRQTGEAGDHVGSAGAEIDDVHHNRCPIFRIRTKNPGSRMKSRVKNGIGGEEFRLRVSGKSLTRYLRTCPCPDRKECGTGLGSWPRSSTRYPRCTTAPYRALAATAAITHSTVRDEQYNGQR